jgi:hypothetical protein
MLYGNHKSTKYSEKEGYKLGDFVMIDFTPSKRGIFNQPLELRIDNFQDDYFVGLSGSLSPIAVPYKLLPKKIINQTVALY